MIKENKRYVRVCLFVCNRGDTILHHGGLHTDLNQCIQGSLAKWYNGWVEILMFSLVSRKFLAMRNIALYSVGTDFDHVMEKRRETI